MASLWRELITLFPIPGLIVRGQRGKLFPCVTFKIQPCDPYLLIACSPAFCWTLSAQDYPKAEISNGLIHAELMLPDSQNGSYRGTRFDWSGIISSLQYRGP